MRKKKPKRTWRIIIHMVGAQVVSARQFGSDVRLAARALGHTLLTDPTMGGWFDVSGSILDTPF